MPDYQDKWPLFNTTLTCRVKRTSETFLRNVKVRALKYKPDGTLKNDAGMTSF
ncbi:hypothetical protein [Larkinella ripae]